MWRRNYFQILFLKIKIDQQPEILVCFACPGQRLPKYIEYLLVLPLIKLF